ncbi:30S ribosomal protein S19 [Candidatus Woesebacteria bacterium RIFOXYB1_FULL_38_16]|uniref:Small ribosomal subunit protein uS19 n=1 Tax=Candidatus Woesebacteria bacterium RIFOXYB1_FULL_38_16 TaxID=1802538 RepID=A0A1F8CUU5_9BACT|nr:MAG: 30S ribosomal protein S19 [Candidatus Woesebacteria bacterium RIFOXYA1_FULL_38_9]OGM80042.1 MAG: 30S ribosomal protein S19 [Candidatus Woesebacteria bacterium RIFOXYB1_FULL_38_16]
MSRSSKKGPYVDARLVKKVASGMGEKTKPIKTWSRASVIAPEFVGKYFMVHNGRVFIDVFVTEDMVGHRLGEFSPTRTFRGHGQVVKRTADKT